MIPGLKRIRYPCNNAYKWPKFYPIWLNNNFKWPWTCCIRKTWHGICLIIIEFKNYRLKNPQFEIISIYSLKIEIKHTISYIYPIRQFLPLNSIAWCGQTNGWFSIPQVLGKLALHSFHFNCSHFQFYANLDVLSLS